MSRKAMGSGATYITAEEAAAIHKLHVSRIHAWNRSGLLEAHYPGGFGGRKHFRREDVEALLELRELEQDGLKRKLPQVALQALLTSRRVERRLHELLTYLGLVEDVLGTSKEEVTLLYQRAKDFITEPETGDEHWAFDWAKILLGITEEYLDLIVEYTREREPWVVLLEVGRRVAAQSKPGTTTRMYIEHARRNLRNVAYFHARRAHGVREADRLFPGETYAGKLVQTLLPQ